MNIYKHIINVAEYSKKDNNMINEYLDLSDKLEELRNDMNYYTFFGLVDAKSSYYFYAPNIALQIIKDVHKKKDYKGAEEIAIKHLKIVIESLITS